jgi:pimeloyl-ACP methyl ester carboxylesterase
MIKTRSSVPPICQEGTRPVTDTPTLVLVHGGSVTSRAWDPLLAYLRTPAITIDLPGRRHRPADLGELRRLDWERSAAADVTASGAGQVILVGHSSAGYVIPGVAGLLPPGMVTALVFVAATCPAEGQRPVDALSPKLQARTLASREHLHARADGKTLGDLREGEPPIETNLEIIEPDPRMGVEAPEQLFEPMTWAGVPDVPRIFVRGMRDRVIPPDHAAKMALNAKADKVVDLDAEHDVAASVPAELAAVLHQIVTAQL